MTIRVGINGFGRIGRRFVRRALERSDIEVVAASCVFDSGLTQAAGSLAKVFGWYDNEWGCTCRPADLVAIVGERL